MKEIILIIKEVYRFNYWSFYNSMPSWFYKRKKKEPLIALITLLIMLPLWILFTLVIWSLNIEEEAPKIGAFITFFILLLISILYMVITPKKPSKSHNKTLKYVSILISLLFIIVNAYILFAMYEAN